MTLIKNALANLRAHKLRVFTTMIWIIIGIASVILVTSIGAGLEAKMKESTDKISKKKTTIRFEPTNSNMMDSSVFLQPFTKTDIEKISFMEGVQMVGPSSDKLEMSDTYGFDVYMDKKSTSIQLKSYENSDKLSILYGRTFAEEDNDRKVVIITMQNAIDLFENPEDAIGSGVTIDGEIYEIIGVLEEPLQKNENQMNFMYGMSGEIDYQTCLMPKNTFDTLVNKFDYGTDEISSIDILVSQGYDTYEVANNVIMKLQEMHPDLDGSYTTGDMDNSYMELESMISSIDNFVKIITGVSLLVGGIGVMNIMYMSVVERQKEIGIRRAIGAKPRNIMFQFLVESTFITIVGGILGMIVGAILVNYMSNMLPFKAILSLKGFIYAALTSLLTGIIFGIIPAFKASRLDPIKAIQK
ncbi:ABC transporter permease [Paraclostridium ghonii]|uniref:ABC transport system permease protein n=1 Tax=Paraclostridium ghonii TaxID=29358 RepID=A0ABU0N3R2_9FIRM|nr:FtsX-like permease family protein [Paeniclostridium ghonii]MDQ0557771.1 putative ABC transport system permease protein [Paeniclostridium ghonii]